MKGSQSGIQHSDGIVGHIIKNGGTPQQDGTIGSYSEGLDIYHILVN